MYIILYIIYYILYVICYIRDSNPKPFDYKTNALPIELI